MTDKKEIAPRPTELAKTEVKDVATPFGFMKRFATDMERLFEEFEGFRVPPSLFGREFFPFTREFEHVGWVPELEVLHTNGQFIVRADLPGLKKEDIEISLHQNSLIISGERKLESEDKDGETSRSERFFGRFQRALELQPLHQPAMVQMAFEYLKRDQYNDALPLAERAVQLAPKMYPARNVLGRVLLELGQTDRAVKELEEGVRLAPSSPEMHFALARAYTRAGRKVDADREREMFKTLQEKYRQQSDAALTGSSPSTNTEKPNPK